MPSGRTAPDTAPALDVTAQPADAAPDAAPTAPAAVEEFRSEQEAEYGVFVAIQPIDIGGARAFNPGDPVPVSHVENGVVTEDQVARRSKPAAGDAGTGTEA